jgi:hypothetical protein
MTPPMIEPPCQILALDTIFRKADFKVRAHVAVRKPVRQVATTVRVFRICFDQSCDKYGALYDLQLIMIAPSAAQKMPAVMPQTVAPT